MSDTERSPLLSPEGRNDAVATESTPLLNAQSENAGGDGHQGDVEQTTPQSWWPWARSRPTDNKPNKRRRWASLIAIITMGIIVVLIIILGFLVPPAVKEYAQTAAVLEPTDLSLESITADGVRARIRANFRLDASRVQNDNSRRIGKFATSIFRKLQTDKTTVRVRLPQHGNALLGTADVPPLTITLTEGHTTALDFIADLTPGDAAKIRDVANDWLSGNLDRLKVTGVAALRLKSGILPLGTHDIAESLVFEAHDIPSMPDFKIQRLDFHDLPPDEQGKKAVGADVSVVLHNDYPISLAIPSLAFEVLVPNCNPSEPYIKVGDAFTSELQVVPKANITADAKGIIHELSDSLVRACPQTDSSPLDKFMKHYLNGETAEVYVRGKKMENSDSPDWIGGLIEGVTAPIDFPGRSFGNFIRSFSLTDVDFKLPSPFADPGDPEGSPKVSGTIEVLAALPDEFGIEVAVESIRATAELSYKSRNFGSLDLHKWQKANSEKVIGSGTNETLLHITSHVVDVPLNITDSDVFSDILQKLLFGEKNLLIDVDARVDVKAATVLGSLVLKEVPAQGQIPVKPLPGKNLDAIAPHLSDLKVLNTSETGVSMKATVKLTNPTPYAAIIPYFHIYIHDTRHGYRLGEAVARDVDVKRGNNTGVSVSATWDPALLGGEKAQEAGQRLLSEYLSGKNTTITLRPHRNSIPNLPLLSEALSKLNLTFSAPHLELPDEDPDDEDKQRLIRDATFHILSSTASFTLASPLHRDTIYIEHVSATAFYNHTEPIGYILHDGAFPAPPGLSQTPRLPVEWSASHVGYDKLKQALGGSLKLDAVANVTVRLGNWVERIHYEGKGLGARVSL
ncbi:hypothetical protein HJFPF1_06449 [Paramyrothecium foliicola]|nr:hypothetical protein HJFPF1_06449 [Paramyrothecium foliicola]